MFQTTTTGILVGKAEGVTLEVTNAFPFLAVDVLAHDGHHNNKNTASDFGALKMVRGDPGTILRFHSDKGRPTRGESPISQHQQIHLSHLPPLSVNKTHFFQDLDCSDHPVLHHLSVPRLFTSKVERPSSVSSYTLTYP